MKKLKIAQLAPLRLPVPPKKYGGTELVISNLTEELVRRGHTVTLFASGDSKTKAKLVSILPNALNKFKESWKELLYFSLIHSSQVFEKANEFDIIHNHFGPFGLAFSRLVKTPVVTTLHWDLSSIRKWPDTYLALKKYKDNFFVAISNSQRKLSVLNLNFVDVVYNGIDTRKFEFNPKPGKYLAWLGRIDPKKGILEAIEVAKKLRMKLKIGADIPLPEFFEKEVKPKIDGKEIQYLGELNHRQKVNLLKNALCLLNPIKWSEPFGLVMPEAMACGTPVVSFRRGSVGEIVKNGKTGFIVRNIDEMIKAVKKIEKIRREDCRRWVEREFSKEKMAESYEKVYLKILEQKK